MRDIEFRGKRKDNGKWVYGLLVIDTRERPLIQVIQKSGDYASRLEYYLVIPETVGQYIGQEDKNKKKIYKGDVVLFRPDYQGCKYRYEVVWVNMGWRLNILADTHTQRLIIPHKLEVIGTIHDKEEPCHKEA